MRVFLALPVPPMVGAALETATASLKSLFHGMAVPRREGLHFTIFFFGERSVAEVEELKHALRGPMNPVSPITVRWNGLGTFPPAGNLRVVYAAVGEGSDSLIRLQAQIGRLLEDAGVALPVEQRPFQPHLTLGRHKGGPVDRQLLANIALPDDAFIIDRCVLFQSILNRDGAVYLPLAERRLEG